MNEIAGKVEKGIGRVTGNPEKEAEGAGREAAGKVEKESAKAEERGKGKVEELTGKIRQKLND